jgi:hypothetical protein
VDTILEYLRAATSGKGSLRFIIQPTVAILLGIKAGRADVVSGAKPYLRFLISGGEGRREALIEGAKHVSKVFIMAVVVDGIIQYLAYRTVRPGWALTVGILLAGVPYILSRGITNRILRRRAWGRVAAHLPGRLLVLFRLRGRARDSAPRAAHAAGPRRRAPRHGLPL